MSDSPKHRQFDLTGKTAFVSGASRGLGQQFADALSTAGADVAITARNIDSLSETIGIIESNGQTAYPIELEVRSHQSIVASVESAWAAAGTIEIVVNNAGCNIRKPATEVSWDDWNTILETNLRGVFFVAQEHAKRMIDRGYGRMINIGSVTCVNGYAGLGPYCASRGGVKQLTMSLADDWGPHGITVNCLAPGWFKTQQNAVMYEDDSWVEYLTDRIPLRRPGAKGDLGGTLVFLASDASEYVTGQMILVDGGISVGSVRAVPKK
jgi:gluconate 5-dehydrogenase